MIRFFLVGYSFLKTATIMRNSIILKKRYKEISGDNENKIFKQIKNTK